jgi:DNA-binding Lrp family transcriptional regulator
LNDEQRKILRFMSEMTSRTDMNEFAQKMDLTATQLVQDMQQLAKKGYLKKVGTGYSITVKGKTVLKASTPVDSSLKFNFYSGLDNPTGLSAASVKEFLEIALEVDPAVLEFHIYREDLEKWFREAIKDEKFSQELSTIKMTELKGEELKKSIAKAIDIRYGL